MAKKPKPDPWAVAPPEMQPRSEAEIQERRAAFLARHNGAPKPRKKRAPKPAPKAKRPKKPAFDPMKPLPPELQPKFEGDLLQRQGGA